MAKIGKEKSKSKFGPKKIFAFSLIALAIFIAYYVIDSNIMLDSDIQTEPENLDQTQKHVEQVTYDNKISWKDVVDDANYAWKGSMNLKDLFVPSDIDLTIDYNSHNGDALLLLDYSLLDSSIWMYLITGDKIYLEQARAVADDIEQYLLSDNDIVQAVSRIHGPMDSFETTNRNALLAVSKLALLDPNYQELTQKLANSMIHYEIDSNTNLFYTGVFSNGTTGTKEMYLPFGGDVGIESLLKAYEVTSNEKYLDQARNTIVAFWELKNPNTNLIPSWVYSDTLEIKQDFMQQYGAGSFLKNLLHYYYLTSDETIYQIISDYVEAISLYMWDGMRWEYRTNQDGSILSPVVEANFAKLDDALFLVYDLNRTKFHDIFEKAKTDFDHTFKNDFIISNNLVNHAINDDGTPNANQSMLGYAFIAIQNPSMRLYHETGQDVYLSKIQSFYNAIAVIHKRDYGYIAGVNTQTLNDDPLNYFIADSATGVFANKIFITVLPSPNVKVVWITIGHASLEQPFLGTFTDTGWFNEVKFDFEKKMITLNFVTGQGTIKFTNEIESATINGQVYTNFEENALKTQQGTNSYTVTLEQFLPST